MRRRSAVVGLGLALVASAGLSYWMLFPREGGRRGVEPALDALVVDPHAPAPPVVGVPELAADGASSARATVSERSAVEAAAPAMGFEIRVIDEHEKPVPGATVWYQPLERTRRGKLKSFPRADAVTRDDVQDLASVDAASAGIVILPESEAVHAFASDGERWGHAAIQREAPEPRVLQIWPDDALLVRVVDDSGAPCEGVGVVLAPIRIARFADSVETGADGTARFPYVRKELARYTDTEWELRALVLADPPARVDIDRAEPPPEVTLVVPTWGSVELRLLDEFGRPAGSKTFSPTCRLSVSKAEADAGYSRFGEDRFYLYATALEGTALFQRVAIGLDVELSAHGVSLVETKRIVPGPTRAGETVSYEMHLGEDHPVLVFRALDTFGALIRKEEIETGTHMFSGFSTFSGLSTRTDDQGQALVHVQLGDKTKVELKRVSTGDTAEVEAPPDLGPGLHYIGAVVFGGGAPLVAGIVVDERGNALQAELYAAMRLRPDWVLRPEELGRSGKDGRFAFRGHDELDENLEIAAFLQGLAGPAVPFRRGDTGVRIVLSAEGAIEGRVIPLPGMTSDMLRIAVSEPSEGRVRGASVQTQKNQWGTLPEEDGTFRIGELVSGEYTLRVLESNSSREFAGVTGLVVRSGETTRDPRLDPLQLAGEYTHRVVVLAAGTEMIQGTILYGPAGAAELGSAIRIMENGPSYTVLLTGPDAAVDIEVALSGFRVERRNGVSGAAEIEMRRGLAVRLVLDSVAEIPEPPLFIQATLGPVRLGKHVRSDFSAPSLNAQGEAVVFAMEPGPARVGWWVGKRESGGGYRSSGVDIGREVIVEVLDVPGEQRIEITLTAEEMAKLVEASSR